MKQQDMVTIPARVSSLMSRHSLPWRIAATSRPTGSDRTSAWASQVAVMAKYDPTTISGPIIRKTTGTPRARYLYWNGGAVYV